MNQEDTMATMGRYCKAYYARQLSQCPLWRPNLSQLRPEVTDVDGQEQQVARTELQEEDILYLQENYVVTDGIFLDQHVVFDAVTPDWQEFCRATLGFEIPSDLADDDATPEAVAASEAPARA
jgi:hypothetical protein